MLFFCISGAVQPENLYAGKLNSLHNLIGNQDAILVADPQGKVIFSKNAGIQLIPASTLKILTALVALHYMGPDFRFATEFYLGCNASDIQKKRMKVLVADLNKDVADFDDKLMIPCKLLCSMYLFGFQE